MNMRKFQWLLIGLSFLFALGGTAIAWAQNPTGGDPALATYLDNQPHAIPGGGALWYRFNYGGGNSLVTVTLLSGAGSNLRFNVFTPEQMLVWEPRLTPIGRGTVLAINCNSGLPAPGGGCQGNDLVWGGKFRASGTYYVQLLNDNPQAVTFTLTVAGEAVSQCVPAGQPSSGNPTAVPCSSPVANATAAGTPASAQTALSTSAPNTATLTATPTLTPTAATQVVATQIETATLPAVNAPNTFYTDPYHALPLSGQAQTIPGNASIWYRFEYAGDGSNIVVRMENGAFSGLEFTVYLPEQAPAWYNETPIGRGTATLCTASDDTSKCGENGNALLWSGKFRTHGTYFVRVTNPLPNPVQFTLTVTGSGVSVCSASQAQPALQGATPPSSFPCPTGG